MDNNIIVPDVPQGTAPRYKKKKYIAATAIIVILVIAGVFVGLRQWKKSAVVKPARKANNGNILSMAETGKLVDGFSQGLILDPQAKITTSAEGKSGRTGYRMLVTFYESSLPVKQLNDDYAKQYGSGDWKMVNGVSQTGQAYLYSVNKSSGEALQITILSMSAPSVAAQKTLVQIEFYKKNPTQ